MADKESNKPIFFPELSCPDLSVFSYHSLTSNDEICFESCHLCALCNGLSRLGFVFRGHSRPLNCRWPKIHRNKKKQTPPNFTY